MRPEIALTHFGAGADLVERGAELLPKGFADQVHAAFPRLDVGRYLTDAILDQVVRKPSKAPLFTMSWELVRQHVPDTPVSGWRDMVGAAWPGVT